MCECVCYVFVLVNGMFSNRQRKTVNKGNALARNGKFQLFVALYRREIFYETKLMLI